MKLFRLLEVVATTAGAPTAVVPPALVPTAVAPTALVPTAVAPIALVPTAVVPPAELDIFRARLLSEISGAVDLYGGGVWRGENDLETCFF